MLGPNPDSSKVPEALRNSLFWTQHNNAPETLISFNRYAWRSQTEEGRVIGVGYLGTDFTNDTTAFGAGFSFFGKGRFANVQMSPDGKWILLNTFSDPRNTEEECNNLLIYVVQEGDVFKHTTGDPIDYVKPGDIMRLTYNGSNVWDTSNLSYAYFPRRVAILNEGTGEVTVNSPHYDELIEKATNRPGECCETCCYTCTCCKSGEERWDFQVNHISDLQVYKRSSTPPSGETIERL